MPKSITQNDVIDSLEKAEIILTPRYVEPHRGPGDFCPLCLVRDAISRLKKSPLDALTDDQRELALYHKVMVEKPNRKPPEIRRTSGTTWAVQCPVCGIEGPIGSSEDRAAEHWNDRALPGAVQAQGRPNRQLILGTDKHADYIADLEIWANALEAKLAEANGCLERAHKVFGHEMDQRAIEIAALKGAQ